MAQPLPHPNVTSSTPPHGGSTDPNDVRRRMASNQQTGAPGNPHGQAFVEAPAHRDHGGNTDPNEIRRVLASNQPPPNSHSNGQTPSASPQLGVGYTPPIQQQHPSPAQYSPNPGPPSQSYFGQANQMPHNSQNGQHQRVSSPHSYFELLLWLTNILGKWDLPINGIPIPDFGAVAVDQAVLCLCALSTHPKTGSPPPARLLS